MQIQSKSNQFYAFLKIVNFFQDDLKNKKSLLFKELVGDVDSLIADKNESALATIIKKGYNLNVKQCMSFMEISGRQNTNDENQIIIRENITKSYNTDISKKILSDVKQMEKVCNGFGTRIYKAKKIEKLLKTKNIVENYFDSNSYETIYKNDDFSLEILSSLKNIKKALTNELEKPYSNYSSKKHASNHKLELIKRELAYKINHIQHVKKEAIEAHFGEKLERYNILFEDFSNVKHSISEDVLNTIKNLEEKNLPQEVQNIISNLRAIYREITPNKLSIEQNLEINNLYQKRFPQVLEEYILISPRYREKLTSHDESPDKLLLESLVEIKTKLTVVFENLQETNHKKLKVTNKYLKSL